MKFTHFLQKRCAKNAKHFHFSVAKELRLQSLQSLETFLFAHHYILVPMYMHAIKGASLFQDWNGTDHVTTNDSATFLATFLAIQIYFYPYKNG